MVDSTAKCITPMWPWPPNNSADASKSNAFLTEKNSSQRINTTAKSLETGRRHTTIETRGAQTTTSPTYQFALHPLC